MGRSLQFENLMGLIIFTGSLCLMFLTVPIQQIKRFALFGVISGIGIATILILAMQNWLGLWAFHQVDIFYITEIPIFLSAAWVPTEIFLAHFLSRYQHSLLRFILILFVPAVAVGIHYFLILNGLLTYYHWNYIGTYLVSLGIHAGLAIYLNRTYNIPLLSNSNR